MGKIKKDGTKIDNGLKSLIERYFPNQSRLNYGQAVVDYSKEVLGKDISRTQLYLLVNDYTEINFATMFVYDALETVLKQLKDVKDRAREGQRELAPA